MKAAKKFSKNIDKVRPHKKSFIGITRSIRQYFLYVYNLAYLQPKSKEIVINELYIKVHYIHQTERINFFLPIDRLALVTFPCHPNTQHFT